MSEIDSKLEAIAAQVESVRRSVERLEGRLQHEALTLTYPQAAKRLGIGTTKLKRLIKQRVLLTTEIGGRRMVPRSEIERLAAPDVPPPSRRPPKSSKQQKPNQDPRTLETFLRGR